MVTTCPGYSTEFDPNTIFSRILIPVDYSPESRRAMMTACETKERFDSEIFLFVVCESKENGAYRVGFGNPRDLEEIELCAREHLRCFAEDVCQGVPCASCQATYGDDIVEGIADAVRKCRATMVMLPYHARKPLLRSRAEKIVRILDVPVFVLNCAAEDARETEATSHREEAAPCGDKPVILCSSGRILVNPLWVESCRAQRRASCAGSD